jgi:hypothetical protein
MGNLAWAAEPDLPAASDPQGVVDAPELLKVQALGTPETTLPVPDQTAAAGAQPPPRPAYMRAPRGLPKKMLGDQLGIPPMGFGPPGLREFPPVPGAIKGAVLVPSIRGFKIGDDESPEPQDRVYVDFNYFDDVNDAVNRRFGSDLHNIRVYRETFGLEKTFFEGAASVGLRLPLNTLSSDTVIPGLGGTSTDVGDLTVILKSMLWQSHDTGSLFSAGLAVTTPTGPDAFARADFITSFHSTTLQPFVGYLWNWSDFYVHGFTAIDIPTDSNDVTMLYNDVGIGYYLYRNRQCGQLLTGIVPTIEVHVNTPLNHRGAFNINDLAGTPDVVDLTTGTIFELRQRSTLAIGIVTPVTGPKPFNWEVLVQFNLHFGRFGAPGAQAAFCDGQRE